MARYGCLVVGVIIAMIVLVGIVYMWSGWLNRPVGHIGEVFALTQPSPSMGESIAGRPSYSLWHGRAIAYEISALSLLRKQESRA